VSGSGNSPDWGVSRTPSFRTVITSFLARSGRVSSRVRPHFFFHVLGFDHQFGRPRSPGPLCSGNRTAITTPAKSPGLFTDLLTNPAGGGCCIIPFCRRQCQKCEQLRAVVFRRGCCSLHFGLATPSGNFGSPRHDTETSNEAKAADERHGSEPACGESSRQIAQIWPLLGQYRLSKC
jgi:hypothetical protein